MRLVVIESPYAGHVEKNVRYGRMCMHHCLMRGEAPYASALLYTQAGVLNDDVLEERRLGMEAGFAWGAKADLVAVYEDLGLSRGMREGVNRARLAGLPVEFRHLDVCATCLKPLPANGLVAAVGVAYCCPACKPGLP